MKKFLMALFLGLALWSIDVDAGWNVEYATNNRGQTIVRVINHGPDVVSCYFKDAYSYYTFVVPPRAVSGWFLPASNFDLRCR